MIKATTNNNSIQNNKFIYKIKLYFPVLIILLLGLSVSIILFIFLKQEKNRELHNIFYKSFENQSNLIEKELKGHFLLIKALSELITNHNQFDKDNFKSILKLFTKYIYKYSNFFVILTQIKEKPDIDTKFNQSSDALVELDIVSYYTILKENNSVINSNFSLNIQNIYPYLQSSISTNHFFLHIGSNIFNNNANATNHIWITFGIPIKINHRQIKFIGSTLPIVDFLKHINTLNKNYFIDNYLCDKKTKKLLFGLDYSNNIINNSSANSICTKFENTNNTNTNSFVYTYNFKFIQELSIKNDITLVGKINDKFLQKQNQRQLFKLALNLLLTILISGYFFIILKQNIQIKKLVEERTTALTQSTNRYKTLIESLPQQIIYKDINSTFVSCNKNFALSLGFKDPKDIVGKTDFDFYPRKLAEKYRADDMKVIQTKKTIEIEEQHIKNGTEITVLTVKTPFFDEKQNVIGILGVFWDITEQKKAREKLIKSEERLALALDATSDGIYDWNLETGEIYFSNKFFTMLNYMPYEFSYSIQSFFDSLHPADKVYIKEEIQKRIQIADIENFELKFRMKKKTGEYIWVLNKSKIATRNKDGNVIRIVGTLSDISQQKIDEEERERLISELETKNAELERFTYTVSHDLKSPLITIRGFLGLLEQDIKLADSRRINDDINKIKQATDRMHALLEDLLRLSRIGRIMNPPEYVNLGELAKDIIKLVEGRTNPKIKFIIDNNFPICYGDKPRLLEVMQNLIDNAIKYIGIHNPDPIIHIGYNKNENNIIYFVSDNGIGIDKKYHEKIFGLFEKLDQNVDGAGVGLALIKRIIEIHKGEIWVESEGLNKGSKFCFTIKLTPDNYNNQA